jgi:hypothetical protein
MHRVVRLGKKSARSRQASRVGDVRRLRFVDSLLCTILVIAERKGLVAHGVHRIGTCIESQIKDEGKV